MFCFPSIRWWDLGGSTSRMSQLLCHRNLWDWGIQSFLNVAILSLGEKKVFFLVQVNKQKKNPKLRINHSDYAFDLFWQINNRVNSTNHISLFVLLELVLRGWQDSRKHWRKYLHLLAAYSKCCLTGHEGGEWHFVIRNQEFIKNRAFSSVRTN